jgi:hypothetical protein
MVALFAINEGCLVPSGGNLQAIEKSDFFKKSDFFAFKMVWKFPPSCTSYIKVYKII